MSLITRPLLASTVKDFEKIEFPVLATPKLDGIRALKIDDNVVSRRFKPIPNVFVRETLEKVLPDGIDGEIMLVGAENFNQVQSEIMRHTGVPNFVYFAFDYVKDDLEKSYENRIEDLKEWNESNKTSFVHILEPQRITSFETLLQYEKTCIDLGYEGVMIRSASGRYKCGRSTPKDGILGKLKRFLDSEAVVIGFKEKLENKNIKEKNEFGLSKRSSKKEGMVPADTLGSLIVRDEILNCEFDVGSGFNDELREKVWKNKEQYLGKLAKYKYQELLVSGSPRFPVFLGFRHEDDT